MQRLDIMNQGKAYTFPTMLEGMNDADEALLQQTIFNRNLMKKIPKQFDRMNLSEMPPLAVPFVFHGSLAVSAMTASAVTTLISQRVPADHRGVITDRACWFDGAGFRQGAGQLTWSLAVGDGFAYKQGLLQYAFGPDFGTQLTGEGGILLHHNQTIRFDVTTGSDITGLDPMGQTIVRIKGWFLPNSICV